MGPEFQYNLTGTFYGVGLGPGDPGLITLNAINTIKKCQALILPAGDLSKCRAWHIALAAVPEAGSKEIYPFSFVMTGDVNKAHDIHNIAAQKIMGLIDEGKDVAFLTIGDVALYSTYYYIQKKLDSLGYRTCMISGIPSFCAVAAKHNIPIAIGREDVHIIQGNSDPDLSKNLPGTRIYMKSGRALSSLIETLKIQCREEPLSIYAVSNCGFEDERVYRDLEELEASARFHYLTTVIVKRL